MKKKYFLLVVLFAFCATQAQVINFPDANFKAKLLQASLNLPIASGEVLSNIQIDTNNDNEIDVSEASLVYGLSISNSNILDLTGIEYFVNLKKLTCSFNDISSINLSQFPNLEMLNVNGNQLISLDVSQNILLKYLYADENQISSINLDQNLNLESIRLSINLLTNLNVTQNTALKYLSFAFNNINNINLTQNVQLRELDCSFCQLTSLNVNQNVNLTDLTCKNNPLGSIDVSHNTQLIVLDCSDTQLSNLNLSNLNLLQYLFCSDNSISNLDFSQNLQLNDLDCSNNLLEELNLSNLNLSNLICYANDLGALDVSNSSYLTWLDCSDNHNLNYLNIKNGTNYTTQESLDFEIVPFINFSSNPNLNYICVDENEIMEIQNIVSEYGYSNCNVNSYCSFVPGGNFYVIQGNHKYDENSNGCDAYDTVLSNLRFSITDGVNIGFLISNTLGNYSIPVQAGNHTITPIIENPSYFTISPTNIIVDFPTQTSPFTQDFCVTANGIHPDLEVTLVPTVSARPGFDAIYKLIYKNKGTNNQSGTLNLSFDDTILDFVSATPVITNQATNSLSWDFVNLEPFETREITLALNVNSPTETPAVNGGDTLNYTATITSAATDETPDDNTFTLNQTVVNSFDPNDKTCLEGATIAPSEVGKYVHYLIRFENTGTYPAENIVVKDMIDAAKFDENSLVPIKGSHEFVTRINGDKVEFIFENINLPFDDANNDGYVAFKIKTKPTLVSGDTFSNSASIYFDYNLPIVTNTATTSIQALSTQDFEFGNYFALYPNPVHNILNIETKQTIELSSISIYNQLGQLVLVVPSAQNVSKVDVSSLAAGSYFIKVNSDKGTSNAKFIKK